MTARADRAVRVARASADAVARSRSRIASVARRSASEPNESTASAAMRGESGLCGDRRRQSHAAKRNSGGIRRGCVAIVIVM